MRQTACLVVNPIIVDGYASLFNCTMAVRASGGVGVLNPRPPGLQSDSASNWATEAGVCVFNFYIYLNTAEPG